MKIILKILVIMLFPLYAVACVSASRPAAPSSEPQATDIPIIKSTLAPTFTILAPTLTSTSTLTPQVLPTITVTLTPTVVSEVEQKCLQTLSELPKDSKYSGQLVLGRPYFLYNLISGEKYEIPHTYDNFVNEITISPDRTLYAYVYYESSQLVIASSDHIIQRILAIPDRWDLSRWQNDKNLLFVKHEPYPTPDPHWGKYPQTIGLINVFTGEKLILPPDFPEIDQLNPIFSLGDSGTTVYDPILSRVVYERGDHHVVLWDIQNKKQLAQLPTGGLGMTVPMWLPDGSKYIMMAQDGFFYLVDRDGAITQVTHESMFAVNFSWSPDNRHFAFWRTFLKTEDRNLYMLDTFTGQITDLCITAGDYENFMLPATPIWSPNGSSFVVAANFNNNTRSWDLLLIDLDNNTVTKIGEKDSAYGWLSEP